MKMKFAFLLSFLLLPLTSCDFSFRPGTSTEKPTASTTTEGATATDDKTTGADGNKAELITVFSINDVHGSLKENPEEEELGIAKLEYAIKHDADYDPATSIIISCGDTWQGGYLANREKTISDELLSMAGVEAMVIGNHEFDWGIDNIKALKAVSPFPFLACNIRNGNGSHTNELSENSTIIEKGGRKIGIIGAMGGGQESSISTNSLAGYSFDTRTSIIQEEVNYLQTQNCDLILLGIHDSSTSSYVNSIANTFNTTQIQGIFGAHTHTFENTTVGTNKIPFVQAGSNTRGYAKMSFSVKSKKAIDHSYVRAFYSGYNVDSSLLNQDILNKISGADSKYNGSEVLATLSGDFRRYYELDKFVPEIMLNQAVKYGFKNKNELIALHNLSGIRANLSSGPLTREKLFKVEPFENKVKIIKGVSGKSLSSLLGTIKGSYQSEYYAYMRESEEAFASDKTYDVVTIDFVSEGKYGERIFGSATQYDIRDTDPYIFEIMVDYLKENENKVYSASDYR